MRFKKGEQVLWNGEVAIIHSVMKRNPMTGKPVKWYAVKRNIFSVSSHLVAEDSGTLQKMEAK
jgi:hypothetical protein